MKLAARACVLTVAAVAMLLTARALTVAAPGDDVPATDTVPVDDDRFVVHEWGTFTSFSGSDGVKLEFRPLVDNDLPSFVLNRARQSGTAAPYSKASIRVLQRMETPVTYFYTDRERDVRVRVGFPKGLLTEFYPPVETMAPKFDWKKPNETIGDSELDWGTVHLIPTDHLATHVRDPELRKRVEHELTRSLLKGTRPLVDTTVDWGWIGEQAQAEHYSHARETDSAIVHVRREPEKGRPMLPTGDFFEKFLFYRGVGNFQLPLRLTAEGNDAYTLRNDGTDPVRGLFLVTVDGRGIRYRRYDSVDPKGTLTLVNDGEPRTIDDLARDVEATLVAEGLYAKEARSMVNTWRDSWFGERGTRLFYLVPSRITEELLPLHVDPVPDEMVRVLVGRMEIMSPEDEERVFALVRNSAAERQRLAQRPQEEQEADPMTADRMIDPLAEQLGRLLEPGLVRARFASKDNVVRNEAHALLWQLKEYLAARE